jgi:ABC-type sugar transport system ATPase subunit
MNGYDSNQDAELLHAFGVTKSFSGNTVLHDVSLTVARGEVHTIVGENGAGKSTLIKVLGGVYGPDAGRLLIKGEEVVLHSPKDAIKRGIAVIYQDFSLAPHLSVEENIFFGHFPTNRFGVVDRKMMRSKTLELLDRLSVSINPLQAVNRLSIAEQQMVEIAKALSFSAELLIFDEPTAVLDKDSVQSLFGVIRRLLEQKMGVVYISHHLEEIFEIGDRVTVLRDGEVTGSEQVKNVDQVWLVKAMIGREVAVPDATTKTHGKIALSVRDLAIPGLFEDITFEVRQGEILGIAGLVGARRTEIAQAIFGLRRIKSGTISVFGAEVVIDDVKDAIRLGIGYLTEDRKTQGLFLNRPVVENLTMSNLAKIMNWLFIDHRRERLFCEELVRSLDIRLLSMKTDVLNLSGGNQQKVLLGRSLAAGPRILLLDEPTRGIDVGAKQEIYDFIQGLVTRGIAIVLISSELEEILHLSDRIIVLRKGRIAKRLEKAEATKEEIMNAAALSEAQ